MTVVICAVGSRAAFTLLEICLAIFIAMLLVTLAVPSVSGLLAERKIKRSFDAFDALAHEAQSRSLTEQRAYVLAWDEDRIRLRPQLPKAKEPVLDNPHLDFVDHETFDLDLPAALLKKPARQWVFWPSGTCEPATVIYHGTAGEWTASYDPLTVRADFATR